MDVDTMMSDSPPKVDRSLTAVVDKLKIGAVERHIFICTGPKCCKEEEGQTSWTYLKQRLQEKGLTPGPVYRTKVGCLRICQKGPIALVYPEGTWYSYANKGNLDLIIDEHLSKDRVVDKLCFTRHTLPLPVQGDVTTTTPNQPTQLSSEPDESNPS